MKIRTKRITVCRHKLWQWQIIDARKIVGGGLSDTKRDAVNDARIVLCGLLKKRARLKAKAALKGKCGTEPADHVALTWTSEKPKQRGWWWLKMVRLTEYGVAVRKVEEREGRLYVMAGTIGWIAVDDPRIADWEWAGPLVEPESQSGNTASHSAALEGGTQ